MKILSALLCMFPIVHGGLIVWGFYQWIQSTNLLWFLLLLFVVYLFPPLVFRLYSLLFPVQSGKWILNHTPHCRWWVSYQIQMLYAVVPTFEAILRLFPGAYSAWLRLWGSKIGKGVYWTVQVEIIDRHLMHIEDNVIFGHRVICCSHVVHKRQNGNLVLFVKPIYIGKNSFVGAGSRLGPGVSIPPASVLPYNSEHVFRYVH